MNTSPATGRGRPPPTTRRRLLIALANAAGAIGLAGARGVAALRTDRFVDHWLSTLIRRSMPGATIPQSQIDAFVGDVAGDFGVRHRALGMYRTLLPRWLPVGFLESRAALLERQLLTDFTVGSNFFSIDQASEPVEYVGPRTRANPFARYDEA